MADVQSLHCPNCGAAADPQAARCPYCRARLATVSCPQCFALMFAGSAFCPKCGTRFSKAPTEPSSTTCPGCRGALERMTLGDVSLLECRSCDGVWIGAADFERICADREARGAVLARPRPPSTDRPPQARVRYRPCVVCGKMMNRVNFGRLSGTIIDICRGHGAFLDSGELHAIAAFIMEGGLDRARQREKDDLEDERRRLEILRTIESRRHISEAEHGSAFAHGLLDLRRLLKDE